MIAIIDYGIGNLSSVANMFRKIGVKDAEVTANAELIAKADKVLLPGVGAFDAGMGNLEKSGLIPVLSDLALRKKIPVLGICLGMQLLGQRSEEGAKPGLGWIDAETVKFRPDPSQKIKIPHMGWEYIKVKKENPLIDPGGRNRFYFVHSYYVKCHDENDVVATCDYGTEFTCMVNRGNIFGAQFHPEKSLSYGMKLLLNFSRL
jgi:imidazole glycerol-phosphate synthase subunit HisH